MKQIHTISYNTLNIYTWFTSGTIGEHKFNSLLPNIHLVNITVVLHINGQSADQLFNIIICTGTVGALIYYA